MARISWSVCILCAYGTGWSWDHNHIRTARDPLPRKIPRCRHDRNRRVQRRQGKKCRVPQLALQVASKMRSQLLSASLFVLQAAAASWTSTPFNPPSIPLAVRSPYLNTWLPQGQGVALNAAWPTLWAGQTTAWTGLAKVDGQSYSWLGAASVSGSPFTPATQKSFNVRFFVLRNALEG